MYESHLDEPTTAQFRLALGVDPVVTARYQWLSSLVAARPGERIVDLGCGEGATLQFALPNLDGGLALGLDNDLKALQRIRAAHEADGPHPSRLELVHADLNHPLPIVDSSLDAVVSHDLLELLRDPSALLLEAHRVLRPGGRLVLGHLDLDSAVIAGADVALTRRIVHAYCDTQQAWMNSVDGTIGRRLPELVGCSSFTVKDVAARVVLSQSLEEGSFGRLGIDNVMEALLAAGAIPADELAGWRADLDAAAVRGAFLVSVNDYVVLARRA
jgi:SAM-dependent methyltransferase